MNLRARLSERVHIEDIREVLHFIQDDERLREEVYQLIFDKDHIVSYQALWVCTHFSKADVEWLSQRQDELIDAAMTCPHSGKRRMILNLICQQPAADPPRVDFLDFCMERMISREVNWLIICHAPFRNCYRNYAQYWISWSPTYWFLLSVPYEKTP